MALNSFSANQGTQTPILTDNTGGAGGTLIAVQKVDISPTGTAGSIWDGNVGVTSLPNLPGGTITLSNPTGTTVQFNNGTLNAGTINAGTINAATISSLPNLPGGTLNNLASGTINAATAVINSATISVLPNLPGGSIAVTTGTITGGTLGLVTALTTVTTVSNLTNGSIKVTAGTEIVTSGSVNVIAGTVNAGTINTGTINTGTINLGTIVGKDANAAAQTGNPIGFGGTDSGGTIRTVNVDSTGALKVTGAAAGTFVNLTTGTLNAGTIDTLTSGSVRITVGTITVLPNLPQGSINITAGTINTGTINTGTINLGTIVGKDANAAAQSGNPVGVGGTDSGGTIRTIAVDANGGMKVTSGTIDTLTTVSNVTNGSVRITIGTITVLPNLPQGSINVTAGTVNAGTINAGTINTGTINTGTINLGTIVGKDANAVAQTGNPIGIGGTDSGGTIRTINVDSTGAVKVTGASAGTTVTVDHGSIVVTVGTITVLPNLPQGSINVTAGTITAGTINTGTINAGTINIGTIVGKDANAVAQTGNPLAFGGTDSGGTIRTVTVDSSGRLTVNSVAAGTTIGTISVGTINTGTINSATISSGSIVVTSGTQNTGTINTGTINTGTINVGTINAGTINAGTIQINPLVATNLISHAGTSGTLGIGTLVGTASIGAGTALYPTNFRIVAMSGTPEVILAFGTQTNGNQVIHHGLFPAGGGIANPIPFPHGYGTTNSPLTYQILSGAGTVSWDVDYFIHT